MLGRIGDLEIGHTLGRGASCKVKMGRDTTTGQMVAVKIINKEVN